MKQLLYFLIGFCLSITIIAYSYSECIDIENEPNSPSENYPNAELGDYPTTDFDSTLTIKSDILNSLLAQGKHIIHSLLVIQGGPNPSYGYVYISYADCDNREPDCDNPPRKDRYFPWYVQGSAPDGGGICDNRQDRDGDGIPDDEDLYPDDPAPFNVQMISYQTADGTNNSEHVRECYQTDRGDVYCVGADYDPDKPNNLLQNAPWIPYEDSNSSSGSPSGPPTVSNPPEVNPPGSGEQNVQGGEQSTGSETDNQALRGVMDNTGKTATNTSRMVDYMKEMTRAIVNMDRNITRLGTPGGSGSGDGSGGGDGTGDEHSNDDIIENDNQNLQQLKQDAQTGLGQMENAAEYNPSDFDGNLVEGVDYDEITPLEDEPWLTTFISNNPLTQAFSNSGFNTSGSRCSETVDLQAWGLGTHTLSLCEFQSEFQTAGVLLLSLTSLSSLILIVRR